MSATLRNDPPLAAGAAEALSPVAPSATDGAQPGGKLRTSAWSLADQAVVSLGNFCTNILLTRRLTPVQYGIYGLTLGMLLFLNNIHGSLVTYPLSVDGATSDEEGLRGLTRTSLALTLLLAFPLALVLGATAWVLHVPSVFPWLLAALLAWQIQETVRRALLSHLRYRTAIWGDGFSYLGQAVCIGLLVHGGVSSLSIVFAVMAITSLVAAALQIVQLRLTLRSGAPLGKRARHHWKLGRWIAMGNFIGIANIQAVPWTLAAFHGVAEAGKLLALGNLLGVTHPAIFSINSLIVPATARARKTGGWSAAFRAAVHFGLIGALLVIPYYALLLICPHLSLRCFYGAHSPYLGLTTGLRLFAVAYVLMYVSTVIGGLLNGLAKSRASFAIQLGMVSATLLVTLPLAMWGGVTWGLVGAVVSTTAGVIVGSLLLRREKKEGQEICDVMDVAVLRPAVVSAGVST